MSYDIHIIDPETGETIHAAHPHFLRGGTFVQGGTKALWLNITFNYSAWYYRADTLGESTVKRVDTGKGYMEEVEPERGGIPGLAYRSIPEARALVFRAIQNLHGEPGEDYWKPCEGNARMALQDLLTLLLVAPENAKIQIDY